MIRHRLVVLPDLVEAVLVNTDEDRPRVVRCRKEHFVTDDEWGRRIDRRIDAGAPAFAETYRTVIGIDGDNAFAGEKEDVTAAVDRSGNGRGIAGVVIGRAPKFLAGVFVESDDPCVLAADIDQQLVALDDWRSGHAEKALANLVVGVERPLPDFLALVQGEAV